MPMRRKKTIRVAFTVRLPVHFHREGRWVIAHSPLLDLCGQGENRERAISSLQEATQLFLISCHERGTLDAVLKQSGFEADTSEDGDSETCKDVVEVTLPMMVSRHAAEACAH